MNLDHLDCLDPSNNDFATQGGPSLHIFAPGETFCMTKNQNVGWFWCFMMFHDVSMCLCICICIYIYVCVLRLSFWMQMLLDKTQSLILRQHVMWNEQHKNYRHLRHPWVQTRSSPAIQTVPIGPLKVQSLGTCDTEKQNKTNEDIENINRSDAAQAK